MHPKTRIVLSLVVILAFVLGACASPGSQPAQPLQPSGEQLSGTISFMVFGDLSELKGYQELSAAFEANFPAIKVQLIHIPDQGDYRKRVAADLAAGTPADVLLINYRRVAALAAKGALEPLGPYLQKSTIIKESDFYPEAITPFYWKDQLTCIPQNVSSLVVYYNKNLFDQAGLAYPKDDWTWDQFLQTALALTKDLNGDGVTDQHGLGTEASLIRLAPFVWQNGGTILNDPDQPNRLSLDEPASLEAFQWFVDLQVKHHVVPSQVEESAEGSESRFENGRMGMFLNSRRGVPTYRNITAFDWDVAALPRKIEPASILHADAYCMPASVKNKELVWKFIEFANAGLGQTIMATSGRTVPSLRSVAESAVFLDPNFKPKNSRVFVDTIPTILAVPTLVNWPDIESVVSEELERAFYGSVSVEEAIKTATERAQPYFETK